MILGRHVFIAVLCSVVLAACTQDPAGVIVRHHILSDDVKGAKTPFQVEVAQGDNLYLLAKKYNISIRELIDHNDIQPPFKLAPGTVLKLPKPLYHVVKEGDDLYSISRGYGIDMSRLVAANQLHEPFELTAGQQLKLPAKTTPEAGATLAQAPAVPPQNHSTQNTAALEEDLFEDDFLTLPAPRETTRRVVAGAPVPILRGAAPPAALAVRTPDPKAPTPLFRDDALASMITPGAPRPDKKPDRPSVLAHTQPVLKRDTSVVQKTVPAPKNVRFSWPVEGRVISDYGPKDGGLYNDGVNIAAEEGTPIKASEDGVVVYSGNELRGYGNLLLIKHAKGYITAYAHTQRMKVKKGTKVKKGQVVAYVGSTGHVSSPQLHFSLRKGRKAVNPKKYLPG